MISSEELDLLHANICQALGDPKRIQILYALNEQPTNVNDLAALLETPQPTISRHLGVLRQRALVNAERTGTTIVYSLADPRIIQAIEIMRGLLRDLLEQKAQAVR